MNSYCETLQHLLAAAGPTAIRDDERAQAHLVDCTGCFAFLETLGVLEHHLSSLPLVNAPDEVVDRLAKTPKARKREEGLRICVEIIQQVREIAGVSGVHVMAYWQEEAVAEIIRRAGLLPRLHPGA